MSAWVGRENAAFMFEHMETLAADADAQARHLEVLSDRATRPLSATVKTLAAQLPVFEATMSKAGPSAT